MHAFETYAASSPVVDDVVAVAARHGDSETYEASLRDRLLVEEQVAQDFRQRAEAGTWRGSFEGIYASMERDTQSWSYGPRHRVHDPLDGLEVAWAKQIDKRLDDKDEMPVILFDFGGGLALSMVRIAAQEKYSRAIAESKLLLVSSSLGEVPSTEPDKSGYSGAAQVMNKMRDPFYSDNHMDYTRRELDFVQEHQGKVTYVDATATELESMAVAASDGRSVPLLGNVASVHEDSVIMHSHIPDVAVAVLGRLLKKGGVLFLGTTRPIDMKRLSGREYTLSDGRTIRTDEAYQKECERALAVGIATLPRCGVRRGKEWAFGPQEFTQQDGWMPGVIGQLLGRN